MNADARWDGLFPLITKCPELSKKHILEAYKYQPRLEKRLEQLKTVEAVAPVFLKRVSRIEALLFLYFIALLVQALLEREVRRAMAREHIERLPLYLEERECRAPSTERILELLAPSSGTGSGGRGVSSKPLILNSPSCNAPSCVS